MENQNKPILFKPKIITVFQEGYTVDVFWKDLLAGIIVGIVALPLSIAFAIASGVRPEQGLITAVVAGFLISVFSGSRVQIGGPTGAFIVIIYGIVQKFGYDGLAVATVMAGVMLVLLGMLRFGDVIKFIPYPVTVGFTSGIAVIIFSTQVRDFFGLNADGIPEHFLDKWIYYFQNFSSFDPWTLIIAVFSLIILIIWPKISRRIPAPLLVIIFSTLVVNIFNIPVETIGTRFGEISNSFPPLKIPQISWDLIVKMLQPAMAIAMLAGIESLLSAVVADGMTGRQHRSNTELIAQGIANITSPIFGGIPATGAIARTAVNIRNGGTTPMAGIIHAITVLVIFIFLGPLAAHIPMAALAAILIMVAYGMSEWHLFFKLFSGPKSDIAVLLITFLLTVLVDLAVAIEVGIVLASFLFMRRMIAVTEVGFISRDGEEDPDDPMAISKKQVPPGVEVFEINGPFFFGAADKFQRTIRDMKKRPKILILRMRHVPAMDVTGLKALEDLYYWTKKDGTKLVLSGVQEQPRKVITQSKFIDQIGPENVCDNIDLALIRSLSILMNIIENDKKSG